MAAQKNRAGGSIHDAQQDGAANPPLDGASPDVLGAIGSLPEAVFGKPGKSRQTPELRTALNREFGAWSDEKAQKKSRDAITELHTLCKGMFGPVRNSVTDLIIYSSDESFEALRKGLSAKTRAYGAMQNFLTSAYDPNVRDEYRPPEDPESLKRWAGRCKTLRNRYHRLTRWDFMNRFPGAEGMVLWRAVLDSEEGGSLIGCEGRKVKLTSAYSSHSPHYAIDFQSMKDSPVIVFFAPASTIKMTSWLRRSRGEFYEPEVMVSGDVVLKDLFYKDSAPDLQRMSALKEIYEHALVGAPNIDRRDVRAVREKMVA